MGKGRTFGSTVELYEQACPNRSPRGREGRRWYE